MTSAPFPERGTSASGAESFAVLGLASSAVVFGRPLPAVLAFILRRSSSAFVRRSMRIPQNRALRIAVAPDHDNRNVPPLGLIEPAIAAQSLSMAHAEA